MSKFWFAAVLSVTLVSATAFAQCPNMSRHASTRRTTHRQSWVTVSKVEDIVTGSNSSIKTTQPLFPGRYNQPKTTVRQEDTHATRYIVLGVIDGIQYTLQSGPGCASRNLQGSDYEQSIHRYLGR
jgi:hypothetical protein